MDAKVYDCLIVGTGPAGYTASIYLSRYKIGNLLIGKQPGGTITAAHKVENYPGIPAISGMELAERMAEQAKVLGAEIVTEGVARVERVDQPCLPAGKLIKLIEEDEDKGTTGIKGTTGTTGFKVTTEGNKEYYAKAVIVATGTERRKLGVPGETEFVGRGVSYCTNCDAPFFRGKTVAVVGGSDAAVSGAVHLTGFAEKIYLIYRGSHLRAEPVWVEQIANSPKVEVIYETNISRILGYKDTRILGEDGGKLHSIVVSKYPNIETSPEQVRAVELDKNFQDQKYIAVDGVFIEIGGVPASSFLNPLGVQVDQSGYVVANERMETNVAGVFAAGDNTTHSLIMAQAITACAQGAVASSSVFKFIKGQKAPQQLGV